MRVIIRGVVILSLLAALVYGGLRGFAWYLVKEGMDNLTKAFSQYADISYGSIYSSPKIDGTVGVDKLVIRSKMTSDELKVQSIRVSYPNIFQLITAKKDGMPNSMRASITGMNIDLDGPMLSSISKEMQSRNDTSQDRRSSLMNFSTLGCGSINSIGVDELTRMGYSSLDFDIDMDYSYEKIKNLFKWNATVRMKDMSTAKMNVAMRIAPTDILLRRKIKPVIDFVHVESTDDGYAAARNRFCAAQMASTEDAFVDRNVELLSKKVGASFPAEDVNAYKKVMRGEGRLIFEMAPKPGTDLDNIDQYPLRDIIDIMGMKLTLDNQEVDFSKLEWGKSLTTAAGESTSADQQGGVPAGGVPAEPQTSRVPASYHAASSSQLSRYVGFQARIKTRAGLLRDGIIEGAESGSITMRLRTPGGSGYISFPIAMRDIASAEVLY